MKWFLTNLFIPTNKGGRKLLFESYSYVKKKDIANSIVGNTRWDEQSQNFVQLYGPTRMILWSVSDISPTYSPDLSLIESYKLTNKIKEKAAIPDCESSTQRLLANVLVEASGSMLQAAKPDVWKILGAIHRQQTLQEFNWKAVSI